MDYVFKKFFHGKCQNPATGIDPLGCPNPDCPVVCGTPGSIVHFYSDFRYRTFTSIVRLVEELSSPNATAFKQVEKPLMRVVPSTNRRFMRSLPSVLAGHEGLEKRKNTLLLSLLRQFRPLLTVACGGTASGKENGLPNCSWESPFKRYILTFPW